MREVILTSIMIRGRFHTIVRKGLRMKKIVIVIIGFLMIVPSVFANELNPRKGFFIGTIRKRTSLFTDTRRK